MAEFIHLRVHSEYSLVDGLVRIKPMVQLLAQRNMPAVAITDQSNMYGLIKFYRAASAAGIKPLVGADLWVANPEARDKPFRQTLYAMNDKGYQNLLELVSAAYTEGRQADLAILQPQWIAARADGLLALSGAVKGDVGQALLAGKQQLARERVAHWMQVFPSAYYLELQRTGRQGDEVCVHGCVELATELGCPVVATNDVHFLQRDDFEAHEARVCIHDSRMLDDPRRERRFSEEQYLKTSAEMAALFSDIPEAIENSIEIARRCNVTLRLDKYFLPNYPIPDGLTVDEFFIKISREGLEARLADTLDQNAPDYAEQRQLYYDRLKFELDIITDMGFPGYFLIVMDFIRWAKENNIPVGPGRGSGAGSLVAYALLITDLDPIAYDLLFERFLNPERVSMPDFDVDFCMDGRDRVISYVADTYGRDAVSQIITFGTMAARAVVRDVARVQGRPYSLGDRLAKLIPFEVGMTLAKALQAEAGLHDYLATDEEAAEVWDMACRLEGITRNVGKHAGGVVIAPTKLTDFSPLYCDEQGDSLVTQFDKDDVEQAGLVKFDFLGLRTLTIVDWAVSMINSQLQRQGKEALHITRIPLEDEATFELLKNGETTAVFQLESRGMKELIKRLQPDRFEDIIALVALFRPGPLQSGMVDDFINRKHGRAELAYPHPDYQLPELKPVLEPTYGIILYQEQVMQIAQVMAGYSLGGADLLRRAMGKKKAKEMAEQKASFVDGSESQGIARELAEKIFDLVEKFAGYGFNKSHSAAYALVSYQTAWLKCHFPGPFMAAVLTADMQNTDKVVSLIDECRRMQLSLVLPDVNVSQYTFTVDSQQRIVYGLGAVKGLGEGPVESILTAREQDGVFRDLFDFCRRVDLRKVNKRALEALIRSGACDELGPGRARMMASIPEAVKRAEQHTRNADMGMVDLFGEAEAAATTQNAFETTQHIREWPDKERLRQEKETLGLYLTGHPFDEYEQEVRRFARLSIAELKPAKKAQTIVGLVVNVRTVKSKRGGLIGIVTLDDRSGRIDAVLFSEVYEKARELLHNDRVLVVEGPVEVDDFSGGFSVRASKVIDISQARLSFVKELVLLADARDFTDGLLSELKAVFAEPSAQGCSVAMHYQTDSAQVKLRFGDRWRVNPSDQLLQQLKNLLGEDCVQLRYGGQSFV